MKLIKNTINILFILLYPIFCYSIEITLNGSYANSYSTSYQYTKTSYGLDIGFPLNQFMELNSGQTYTNEIYTYTDDYKKYLISKGNILPAGNLTQEYDTTDSFANLSIGLFNYYFSPSIYGGVLNRKSKFKDYFGQVSEEETPLTWDAGAALSIRMGRHFKLKITYRISPSGVNSPSGSPYYDNSYWGGITLSF